MFIALNNSILKKKTNFTKKCEYYLQKKIYCSLKSSSIINLKIERNFFFKNYLKTIFLACIINITSFAFSEYSDKNQKKASYTNNGLTSITYLNGEGPTPKWGDFVKINYVIYLLDKNNNIQKIDSTYERYTPFTFRHGSGQVIIGIEEAIHNMNTGTKKRVIIPDNLGYISLNLGPVPPLDINRHKLFKQEKNETLDNKQLFVDIELVKIIKNSR
nr:fkbp-like protein [Cryptomonas curvata]|mmetsp:Transcript_19183/g.40346  ORF Transcript_19183/g.40346 Transcript_19183/m.40346 type:complete len:216 (-) Transcript_19183:81-728(-)